METLTKTEIDDMIMDLLMAQGFLDAKGKGFKQKGIDRLDNLYLKLNELQEKVYQSN